MLKIEIDSLKTELNRRFEEMAIIQSSHSVKTNSNVDRPPKLDREAGDVPKAVGRVDQKVKLRLFNKILKYINSMIPEEIYLTIVTTIVGVFGLLFTWLQFRLTRKKRKDDLFNLRYSFYKKVSEMWIATSHPNIRPLDITDLIPISEEARFLFGKDIADHILSFEDKKATHDLFPDDDFSQPFDKYLELR